MTILLNILNIVILMLFAPSYVGVIRKIKAWMQNRQGASIVQPYFDLWKLFHKDEVIPTDASWIFLWVPFVLFAISAFLFLSIAFVPGITSGGAMTDFIVVVGLLGLMAFLLSLAGIDTGSAFGGFGSSREMTLAAITEGTLFFSFLPVALVTHATNLVTMSQMVMGLSLTNYFPVFIAFLGYFIALMCETGRIPFDNAATHLELTMIHEAMILEYSGKRLALIEWASANKFLFFILLGVNVFFPWTPVIAGSALMTTLVAVVVTLLKSLVLVGIIGLIESSIAKLRFFRLPDLLLTGFIFGVIALIVSGI